MMIPAVGLLQGRQLPPYTHMLDLNRSFGAANAMHAARR
jgi:hypothetical protein